MRHCTANVIITPGV